MVILFYSFFLSLIDGCLKYKNKEKPKTGPQLNYDTNIGPKPDTEHVASKILQKID